MKAVTWQGRRDPVQERRSMADRHGIQTLDFNKHTVDDLRERTEGRGPDSIVNAMGMESNV